MFRVPALMVVINANVLLAPATVAVPPIVAVLK
jgi:hypothetical protein